MAGVPTPAAIAQYLQWLPHHRGRSGRITAPETVRAYASAVPKAFVGIMFLTELDDWSGRDRLHHNVRTTWGDRAPATFNARRAAVSSALTYFESQQWIRDATVVLTGLPRKPQPTPIRKRCLASRPLGGTKRPPSTTETH